MIVPEAQYGAVLMNTKTYEIDYYTLEMTFNDRWYEWLSYHLYK